MGAAAEDLQGEGLVDAALAFLEKALQQTIDLEYGALIRPIIADEIKANLHTMSTRLALLLVRVAFASEQTRSLVTNILSRQPGKKPEQSISPDVLNDILDRSAEAAKAKITRKTPELEKLITEAQSWFETKEKKPDV